MELKISPLQVINIYELKIHANRFRQKLRLESTEKLQKFINIK